MRREPRAAEAAVVEPRELIGSDVGTHATDAARLVLTELLDDVERQRVVKTIDARVDLHRAREAHCFTHRQIPLERQIRRRIAAVFRQWIFFWIFEHVAMTVRAAGGKMMAWFARMWMGAYAGRCFRHLRPFLRIRHR